MRLEACHVAGSRTVHLSHTALALEGLCGITVEYHDEPDLAVLCDECFAQAVAAGSDVSAWLAEDGVPALLPLAA